MTAKIKTDKTFLGNWRYVEVDEKGKTIDKGQVHSKTIEPLPVEKLVGVTSVADADARLERKIKGDNLSSKMLSSLDALLGDPAKMDELIEKKEFDKALKSILRTKTDDKEKLGQLRTPGEFKTFLTGILDKMLGYTTSLFEGTKTDEERAKLSAITEYLIETTASSVLMVEKETFRDEIEKLTRRFKESDRQLDAEMQENAQNQKKLDELIVEHKKLDVEVGAAEAAVAAAREKFVGSMQTIASTFSSESADLTRRTEVRNDLSSKYSKKNERQRGIISIISERITGLKNRKAVAEAQENALS